MAENEMTSKKKWGVALIVLPILLWLLVALANGFNFSHAWLGSAGVDFFLGIVAVILIIVGAVLYSGKRKSNGRHSMLHISNSACSPTVWGKASGRKNLVES